MLVAPVNVEVRQLYREKNRDVNAEIRKLKRNELQDRIEQLEDDFRINSSHELFKAGGRNYQKEN